MLHHQSFDMDAYVERIQNSPCFICEMVAGRSNGNYIVYQDDAAIVFLNKYPTLYGYTLVAPREHREQITADFSMDEFLALQRFVYRVAEAVRQEVPTERMYILSLGSQQGNRHVHWHIAPLPPDVPFEEQQLAALSLKRGVLQISDDEMTTLAARIRKRLVGS